MNEDKIKAFAEFCLDNGRRKLDEEEKEIIMIRYSRFYWQ